MRQLPIWSSRHVQTIGSFLLPGPDDIPPVAEHLIELDDGDRLVLMENSALGLERERLILLVHGLSGCYQSNFMIRMNRRFVEQGYLTFRLNLRGCGPGLRHARRSCNAGRSEDLRQTLHWLRERFPSRPVTVVGFSLGANILLKMAGEDGPRPSGLMDRLIAVSPPLDLKQAVLHMSPFYSKYFAWRLRKDIADLQLRFPELAELDVSSCRSILDIDENYTAPRGGYRDATDYYSQSSSIGFLDRIEVGGVVLGAMDDPIIDGFNYSGLAPHPSLEYCILPHGGHVGFLNSPFGSDFRWMDDFVLGRAER